MLNKGKQGSSRRKGDEYQDLTSMRFALEYCIERKPMDIYLEYEKSGNLDDIVIFSGTDIFAYQVKYAVNPLENYGVNDLVDSSSPVFFGKFASSWKLLSSRHQSYNLAIGLYSNRGLCSSLVDLLNPNGKFQESVIENRRHNDAKTIRLDLFNASGLTEDEFKSFLGSFRFTFGPPTLAEQERHIKAVLLSDELGLSGDAIFYDIKEDVKNNAIFSRDPITLEHMDGLLEKAKSRLLILQVFPINKEHFIEQKSLSDGIDMALPQIGDGYLIVAGLPGSGKSTSLTMYFDGLERSTYEVFKYYCFIGINDNAQGMRTQAESFRSHILDEFHRKYPHILKRRYDYSEQNFIECLEVLAKFFLEQNRQLIILLDGLDHVERLESEVRETLISAMPSNVPRGIVIVVGTQELHKWPFFLERAKECPNRYIKMPLFSESETENYLVNKRGIADLSRSDIVEIQNKSRGLPLYLNYMAEKILASNESASSHISSSPLVEGDIRNYYGMLWDGFDRRGMVNAKHLCVIMSCLRFSVHRDMLFELSDFKRPDFEEAFKHISHLLQNTEGRLSIFHDSFRVFVISKINADWIADVNRDICELLLKQKDSPLWFSHVFRYCFESENYEYILNEVNEEFVDRALVHCRPMDEILDAIHWATEAAFKINDIVHLSRLGSLRYRTNERLEHNLNQGLLAEALLALGREQDVLTFAYSSDTNSLLSDRNATLEIMYQLTEVGKIELGRKLFEIFVDTYKGYSEDEDGIANSEIEGIARCLAIYEKSQANSLKWLSQFNSSEIDDKQKGKLFSGYNPYLEAYVDTLAKFGYLQKLKLLRHVKVMFPNMFMRRSVIRALAHNNHDNALAEAILGYLKIEQPFGDIEFAYYVAKAGLQSNIVAAIAGTVETPTAIPPKHIFHDSPLFRDYLYSFIVVSYESSSEVHQNLSEVIGVNQTLWNSAVRHLFLAGYCIGQSLRGNSDWLDNARESIRILADAKKGRSERIPEVLDLIKRILPISISLLSEQVRRKFPNNLDEWISNLGSLRNSMIWDTHFGFGESIQDFEFELKLWRKLAKISEATSALTPILKSCTKTYEESTLLKGESRSSHFLTLSTIMAKCGMRNDAEKWLQYGIRSSLIYGYHKDITLFYLIDILNLINQRQPELALERCARVLTLVDWLPHLTNGRETKHVPRMIFNAVLKVNRQAAFDLFIQFSKTLARWQMSDCLEDFILSLDEGVPEYLWCVTEFFAHHFDRDDKHDNPIMRTRRHIFDIVRKSCSAEMVDEFEKRFYNFMLTEITPRLWPVDIKRDRNIHEAYGEDNGQNETKSASEYKLDNRQVTIEEILEECKVSFTDFLGILKKLKSQNDYFYNNELVNTSLGHHIATARTVDDLLPIKEFVESKWHRESAKVIGQLGERFFNLGDISNSITCFGLAYSCEDSWSPWKSNTKYLESIATIDKNLAREYVLRECYDLIKGYSNGFKAPPTAAFGLDALGELEMLENVFNDFLVHCERMFSQLPQENNYVWLGDFKQTESIDDKILDFVIEQISTPEVDYGNRLIRAVARLMVFRPDKVMPVFVAEMMSASGRSLRRLLTIFHCVSAQYPQTLIQHSYAFGEMLNREDFFCRQITLSILHNISKVFLLETSIMDSIQELTAKRSNVQSSTEHTLLKNPSYVFKKFLKANTQFSFFAQIESAERVLELPEGVLVAAIEEHLLSTGWSMEAEEERVGDDWDGNVHPQGWPIIWITTEFQELVADVLWDILNRMDNNCEITNRQAGMLWQIIQPADPSHVLQDPLPRPLDIEPLNVLGKEIWFDELSKSKSLEIGTIKKDEVDWVTVFEKRTMAYEEEYNVPFRQLLSLRGFLIPQQLYGGVDKIKDLDLFVERILPPLFESLTIEQAQAELSTRGYVHSLNTIECMSLLATHANSIAFLGHLDIASVSSLIMNDFGLSFKDMSIVNDKDEIVGKYEVWQEGYPTEFYSREKLSHGTRLQLRSDFLSDVCQYYGKIFCTITDEDRAHFESIYKMEPNDMVHSERYTIYHF